MQEYKSYLKGVNTITFEESEEIYTKLISGIDFNDEYTKFLWDDLTEHVMDYAAIRSGWLLLSREDRFEKDNRRTLKHNIVIKAFDKLSSNFEKQGKETGWREQLGSERKRIGDFACYIAFIYGLNAR